ncbi:hypothetical protein KUL25_11300 [Rhodobacteraceae bacterium N5(2021)]|uniref:Beta/gamma crystallin n=1 Tax=Gymnodinialimonas phycosphaerae TaxID=2841589 RepID=A0A975TRW1_9RHOB|nr:hypothetical protein [Gymnodinialimonas phycosphaerae]MBY4893350.1 hypothetical protein [Gymnodinialimonas phycosphaerae]
MKLNVKTLALVALATCAAVPASANTFLGARMAADTSDVDIISVPGPALVREVRFCVVNCAVHFGDVDVRFAIGTSQDLPVRRIVRPGNCTNWLDLRGPVRNIDEIRFRYQTIVNAGPQAIVTAHGR